MLFAALMDKPESRPGSRLKYAIRTAAGADEFSGKFMVRVPRSLHRELAEYAEREGVSLNHVVSTALSKAVASRTRTVVRNGPLTVVVDAETGRILVDSSENVVREGFTMALSAASNRTAVLLDPESHTIVVKRRLFDLKQASAKTVNQHRRARRSEASRELAQASRYAALHVVAR